MDKSDTAYISEQNEQSPPLVQEKDKSEQECEQDEIVNEESKPLSRNARKRKLKFEQMQAHWKEKKRLKKEQKKQKALEKKELTNDEGIHLLFLQNSRRPIS